MGYSGFEIDGLDGGLANPSALLLRQQAGDRGI